ncbi:MAG TPA: glycosyltransferase family 4 protein, partial [Anaerolineales bacterium]|nr:glycosyltransferase family 4 protein [Anaerolineales bacterium]
MNIIAVAGSTIPSDTANSLQVMKACQALAQLDQQVTLLVPGVQNKSVDLQTHYGLQANFPIEWLASPSRRLFTWRAVRRARALKADLLYSWFPQSAVFGLISRLPVILEVHIQPTGHFGPLWYRLFANLRGRKRLAFITRALVALLERDFGIHFPKAEAVIAPNGV